MQGCRWFNYLSIDTTYHILQPYRIVFIGRIPAIGHGKFYVARGDICRTANATLVASKAETLKKLSLAIRNNKCLFVPPYKLYGKSERISFFTF